VAAPDLVRVAHRCLRDLAEIEPHHHVLVVTDDETAEVAAAWSAAATALAAEVVTLRMEPRARHGEEPPPLVAAAMRAADVVVQAVAYALTHTDASRAAMAAGAQVFVLRGITAEMMRSDLMRVDYAALRSVTERVAERLRGGGELRITTPAGTDVRCRIDGREVFVLAGGTGPGRFGGARSGEAALAPIEGSAQGTVVIEHAMDNLGLIDAPIALELRGGEVVRITGGSSARELERLVDEAGPGARNLAEIAIGTNPAARLTANIAEAKKVLGTVHVAVGDNLSLGGSVRAGLHLDGLLLEPTLTVDGRALVDGGRLQLEDPGLEDDPAQGDPAPAEGGGGT
jgi:leucyl aminopeptidase (aminopeptidase T)